ncbi:hypothetical protein D9758_005589 [Tetrapyrgos nigripes]|uniref:DUF6533 domain-containing protein n=1 Tax=Tetrapyrgos nigripes TaxID=182062 RepID=A0A8H5GGI8_9AGAR|nr:hypothetical protein D9758_005589 [Tetrapyrgos nigripes]
MASRGRKPRIRVQTVTDIITQQTKQKQRNQRSTKRRRCRCCGVMMSERNALNHERAAFIAEKGAEAAQKVAEAMEAALLEADYEDNGDLDLDEDTAIHVITVPRENVPQDVTIPPAEEQPIESGNEADVFIDDSVPFEDIGEINIPDDSGTDEGDREHDRLLDEEHGVDWEKEEAEYSEVGGASSDEFDGIEEEITRGLAADELAMEELLAELEYEDVLSDEELTALCTFAFKLKSNITNAGFDMLPFVFPREPVKTWKATQREVAELSGLHPQIYDMCVNSCLAYTGLYSEHTTCQFCGEQRLRPDGKPRKLFVYIPLIPRLIGYYRTESWSFWLQYIGPVVLRDQLPDAIFTHFLQFEYTEEDIQKILGFANWVYKYEEGQQTIGHPSYSTWTSSHSRPHRANRLDLGKLGKLTIHPSFLTTRFAPSPAPNAVKKCCAEVKKSYDRSRVTRWAAVCINFEDGDTIRASILPYAEDRRDATFVRFDALIDQNARVRNVDIEEQRAVFFGRLQHLFVVDFPAAPALGLQEPRTFILAGVERCDVLFKDQIGFSYYANLKPLEVLDITTVHVIMMDSVDASTLYDFRLDNYLYLLATVILYYDYLLTLDDEIELVWKTPLRKGHLLFFANRYLPFVGSVVGTLLLFYPSLNDAVRIFCVVSFPYSHLPFEQSCRVVFFCRDVYAASLQSFGQALLAQRVYAMYGCSRRILVFLIGFTLIMIGVTCFFAFVNNLNSNIFFMTKEGCHASLDSTMSLQVASAWEAIFVYDLVLLGFTLFKARQNACRMQTLKSIGRGSLMQVLVSDGKLYFVVVDLSNALNIVSFYAGLSPSNCSVLTQLFMPGQFTGSQGRSSDVCELHLSLHDVKTDAKLAGPGGSQQRDGM